MYFLKYLFKKNFWECFYVKMLYLTLVSCVRYWKKALLQVFATCVAISMCKSNQESRFFAECTVITSTLPALMLPTGTFDSCLLVPITSNSTLSLFKINISIIIHEQTSAVQLCTAFSALLRWIFQIGSKPLKI